MATTAIRHLFFAPSIAVARLGASTTPMDAFTWGPGDPHIFETRIRPDWTLDVDVIGNVTARLPDELVLRDGIWHRPVAPFVELWALVGDGADRKGWTPKPVTPELLAANDLTPGDITFTVTAMNRKAARRTGLPNLRFGTFPPVVLDGDDHTPVPLRATSPPGVANPMIPAGRHIPLGSVQVLRPQAQPAQHPFPDAVSLDVVRLRFTPAAGWCYGPPAASQTSPPAVDPERAFLNPDAGWFGAPRSSIVDPVDTADVQDGPPPQPTNVGARRPAADRSLGVVDDTCDAVIAASLHAHNAELVAHANIAVAPPHFAPDRRPFLSLADEINDRQHDPSRDDDLTSDKLGRWVKDLFERIYETVSLFGVDFYRDRFAAELSGQALADTTIFDDRVPQPDRAMGGRDVLRDRDIPIAAPSADEPFPLAARAREQHRELADLNQLRSWVQTHPDRLAELVREPFTVWPGESPGASTMRMPPFMRNSNAYPLTMARWQYDLLMKWKKAVLAGDTEAFAALPLSAAQDEASRGLSSTAARRRQEILDLLPEDHK